MQTFTSLFLICFGITQLSATLFGRRALSFIGPSLWLGWGVGLMGLLGGGVGLLTVAESLTGWIPFVAVLLISPLVTFLSLLCGSWIVPPPHPDEIFSTRHPDHAGCHRVTIPDPSVELAETPANQTGIPAYLLTPHSPRGGAVCIVPGSGDNKVGFKWRLVRALLKQGLTVLTLDPPGHGEYRHRPMSHPDCLSIISAALDFLHRQPQVNRIGIIGISMGGALTLNALANGRRDRPVRLAKPDMSNEAELPSTNSPHVLVIVATPTVLRFNRHILRREIWQALRAPVLDLFSEISVRQMRQSWLRGGLRSRQNGFELFRRFAPLDSLAKLPPSLPTLLIYGRRDPIAPPEMGQAMHAAAPHTELRLVNQASHVTLTLMNDVAQQIATWLTHKLHDTN